MRADSYCHHCTVGPCQRLMCYDGELKARQGKSVSKAADSRSLHGCLDLGSSRDQLCLKLAWLLRSPRVFCRNLCGQKAGKE